MESLPLLPFLVCMVMVGIIHHRCLRKVQEAYAKRGLAVPELSTLPAGTRASGAWFLFYPLPGDPPELAEEKRGILQEVKRKTWRVTLIGMPVVVAAAVYVVLSGSR